MCNEVTIPVSLRENKPGNRPRQTVYRSTLGCKTLQDSEIFRSSALLNKASTQLHKSFCDTPWESSRSNPTAKTSDVGKGLPEALRECISPAMSRQASLHAASMASVFMREGGMDSVGLGSHKLEKDQVDCNLKVVCVHEVVV
jgi:hypothetical protein